MMGEKGKVDLNKRTHVLTAASDHSHMLIKCHDKLRMRRLAIPTENWSCESRCHLRCQGRNFAKFDERSRKSVLKVFGIRRIHRNKRGSNKCYESRAEDWSNIAVKRAHWTSS